MSGKTGKRLPWFRFYTADWRGDAELRSVGFAARGLWIDMLTLMHEADPYGHLVAGGRPLDAARLAARLGGTAKEIQGLLAILEAEGVFSRTEDGPIYSRRMVEDAEKAERDRAYGSKGGNPNLRSKAGQNGTENPSGGQNGGGKDKARVNPPNNPDSYQQDNLLLKARAGAPRASQRPEPEEASGLRPDGVLTPAAEPVPLDARRVLWSEGLNRLKRISGKPDQAARTLLGKLCREAADDCALVSSMLHQAEADRIGDPIPWLHAAISARTGRGRSDDGRRSADTRNRLDYLSDILAEGRA